MNIKKLSGRKLIISFILIMVVLICALLFINGNRAQKTDLDNLASKPTIEQTPKVEDQRPQIEKCTFIEDSEPGWLPITNPIPTASISHENGESIWEWKYRNSKEYKFAITLRDKYLSLQYGFLGNYVEGIDISDAVERFSYSDGNIDVKLITIYEYDNNIYAVFSFQNDNRTAFLKIHFADDTFNKFVYMDDDIKDITFIYSTDTSSLEPINEVILRYSEGKYSVDIVSSNYNKSLILPEAIQNPIGFYHNNNDICLEAKEGEHYAIYSVDFMNNTVKKVTNTNKVENILSMQEIFLSKPKSNLLDLFVVGEYKNTLAIFGSDGKRGGFHEKEIFSLVDKKTRKQLLYVESNFEVPRIQYYIDSENGYCYVLHDTYINSYINKYDMSTGNVVWQYESNYLNYFTVVDNVIYLIKESSAVIIDSSTGMEVSEVEISSYETVLSDTSKNAQKLFIIKNDLNNTVKLLNKYGNVIKELSGNVYYYNVSEIILLKSISQDNESQIFKYISFDNPNEEIEIILNFEEELQVLSNKYLLITKGNSIKLFSIRDKKYVWEKEIEEFCSARIFKDNVYISGKYFVCASVKEGNEKWRVDNYYNAQIDYIFSLGKKLFISHYVSAINRNIYRVYDVDTGEYLYQISNFPVVSQSANIDPFYLGADKAYISNSDGGICVIQE